MAAEFTDIGGSWTGTYRYDKGARPCSFTAWLSDEASHVSGESMEPNHFAPIAADTLLAALTGSREGQAVQFVKTYTDLEIERVQYKGTVDAGFRRITGVWHILGAGHCRGSFVMIREPMTSAAKRRAKEDAEMDAG